MLSIVFLRVTSSIILFWENISQIQSLNNHVISSKTGVPGNQVASLTQQLKQLPK